MNDDHATRSRVLDVLHRAIEGMSQPTKPGSSLSRLATITESCPPPHTDRTRETGLYCLEWAGEGAQLLCVVALPTTVSGAETSSVPACSRTLWARALESLRGNVELEVIECPEAVETFAGHRLIERWDDLEGLLPGETVLVPLASPVAEAVWAWREIDRDRPATGPLAHGIERLLVGMYRTDWVEMAGGAQQIVDAFHAVLREAGRLRGTAGTRH